MPTKTYTCFVTGEIIPPERAEYLLSEGVPEHMLTSINGSKMVHKPRKMIVVDDSHTHFFCDQVSDHRIYSKERFAKVNKSSVDPQETNKAKEALADSAPKEEREEDEE